ncbi:MAG TPA: HEAT repeat domain-containing protein, partial [Planctomycetota bacterium]|nr:HEAT repeat domain-containing protein [Planctomycetota bacterium]
HFVATWRGIEPLKTSATVTLVLIACAGCGGSKMTTAQQLDSPAGVERVQGILTVKEQNLTAEIPRLIDFLEDPDVSVRMTAADTLRKMTGQEFGYVAWAAEPERRAAAARWREWWNSRGRGATGKTAASGGGNS